MIKLKQVARKSKIEKEGHDEYNILGGTMRNSNSCYYEQFSEPEKQQRAVPALFWFNRLQGMSALLQVLQMRKLYFVRTLRHM